MRIIGLDPGLQRMGWGVIDAGLGRLRHVAHGVIATPRITGVAERLVALHDGLQTVIAAHGPDAAAVEETFVNKNGASTLKLGHARGICLLVPALAGLGVHEYPTNLVKKSVVGAGHADKQQVMAMVRVLLPGCGINQEDAADALAVAICHAHHAETKSRVGGILAGAAR